MLATFIFCRDSRMSPSAAPAPAVTGLGLKNCGALHCTQTADPAGVAQEDWETQTSLGLKEGVALSLMEPVDPGAALADQQTDTSPGMNGSVTLGPMQPAQEADAGDAPSATHTKNVKMVIKCALKNAMALDNSQYAVFSEMVEGYVNLVSRMMRRASLVMLYHVTKLASEGGPVPNLFKEKDTFWKNWLKLDVGFFPEATSAIKGPPLDYDALVLQHFSDVKEHLGPVMGEGAGFVAAYPSYFDQVIAYAATTFETTVCNNAWVPLFPRLARLTKTMVRSNAFGELGGIRTYDIMKQIRAREPDYTGWPDAAKDYAAEVRRRLLFDPRVSKCMYDEYGKTLHFRDLLMFNYWMTTRLTELGAKRISLSPVVKVARVHVRLDTKVLLSIAKAACPTAPAVAAFVALDAVHKQRVDDDNPGAPAFHNPDNGAHSLLPSTARPIVGKRSPELTDAQWAKVKEDVKRDQEAHDATVRSIRATDVYKTRKAEYDAYIDAKVRAGSSLFAGLPKRRGWAFDGSVCTDGVSVSLQYSKDVVVEEGAGKVRKKPAKKVAEPSEEYEKNLSTLIVGEGEGSKHTIVAGIDPGRANLATIAYVLDERTGKHFSNAPKKKSWSISRGQYYAEAGIFKTNSAKAERTAHLKDAWADLGEEDDAGARGSLRTASPSEVVTYLERYAHIREAWWTSALKRRESRARFQQYIGKRKVLDGFFAMVKRQLEALFPGAKIKLGYGSAGEKMKPTGKGEISVPTTGTFKACKRVFKDDMSVVDESLTTKVGWETGKPKDAVYRLPGERPQSAGKGLTHTLVELGHAPYSKNNLMPKVRDDHLEAVEQFNAERLKAVKRRRCGIPFEASGASEEKENVATEVDGKKKKNSEARYPEVRGLRFCPERRLYLDRDRESAVAIARLRTLELLGKPRPAPFVKGFKTPTTEKSNQLATNKKRVTTHAKAGEKGRRTRTVAPTLE